MDNKNPSRACEAGGEPDTGRWRVPGQPWWCYKLETSLAYISLCLSKQNKTHRFNMKYLSTLAWPPNPGHKSPSFQRWLWLRLGSFEGCIDCLFLTLPATFGSPRTGDCSPLTSVQLWEKPPPRWATFATHLGLPMGFLIGKNCREEAGEQGSTFDLLWSEEGKRHLLAPSGCITCLPVGPGGSDKSQSNLPFSQLILPRVWDS